MAKATSYNVAGNREDLSDILTILEPEVTPVTSMAKKQKASNTTFEWQVDDLQEVEFAGVNEGEDVSAFTNASANRARLGNYIQKFRRTFAVSDIQELTNTAAVSSEFAYAEGKAAREIKRDVEAAICSAQDKQQDGGAGAPYLTRGMFKWLGSGGQPSDVPAAFQSVAHDSTDPLTEDKLNLVLQELYEANGMPGGQLTLVATPNVKTDISDFARDGGNSSSKSVYRVNQDAESKKITLTVNTYEGDFGMVNVIPSLFLKRQSGSSALTDHAALLIDPEYIALHQLKAESKTELEDQGGGRRGFCDIICGLACLAPKAHGRIE